MTVVDIMIMIMTYSPTGEVQFNVWLVGGVWP